MKLNLEKQKILIIFGFLVFSLILRELPYVNVLVAGKLWIFYGLLFLFLVFPWKIHYSYLVFLSILFLLVAFLFTFTRLYFISEALGLGIYFFLWVAVILRTIEFLKLGKR